MIDKATTNLLDTFLSESIQDVLDDKFQNAICNFQHDSRHIEDKEYDQFILVTISSIRFKSLVLLHFQDNRDFKDFIYDVQGLSNKSNDQLFYDSLSEMSNAIAGSLKRKLENSFSVIGMSTPKLLNQNAIDFFLNSHSTYIKQTEINLDNRFHLGINFLLFADNKYDFILKRPNKNEEDLESGDLLLF